MWTAEAVVVCALALLGRSPATFAPIVYVERPPLEASPLAEAFTLEGDHRIHLVMTGTMVLRARRAAERCGDLETIRLVASILVHEKWHLDNGDDEREAYLAQLTTLNYVGAGPGSAAYHQVQRAMRVVLSRRDPAPLHPRSPAVAAGR